MYPHANTYCSYMPLKGGQLQYALQNHTIGLCSAEETKLNTPGMEWEWINYGIVFINMWTIPLNHNNYISASCTSLLWGLPDILILQIK